MVKLYYNEWSHFKGAADNNPLLERKGGKTTSLFYDDEISMEKEWLERLEKETTSIDSYSYTIPTKAGPTSVNSLHSGW